MVSGLLTGIDVDWEIYPKHSTLSSYRGDTLPQVTDSGSRRNISRVFLHDLAKASEELLCQHIRGRGNRPTAHLGNLAGNVCRDLVLDTGTGITFCGQLNPRSAGGV
jgi:hypothetical protein